jgi:hypothetical protein
MEENATPDDSVKKRKDLAAGLINLAGFGLIVAVIVVVVYVLNFDGRLSDDPTAWGAFGDYVGGVLNPVFAFLAFIALLLTIILQSRELELTRVELKNSADALKDSRDIADQQRQLTFKNAQKEDVFRIISFIYDEINRLNNEKFKVFLFTNEFNSFEMYEMSVTSLFGSQKREDIHLRFPNGYDTGQNEYWKHNKNILCQYANRLFELAQYLVIFDNLSGSKVLTEYYRIRTYPIAFDMYSQNYLEVEILNKFISDNAPA